MKRFIDLRNNGTYYRFAWFDTTTDTFESFDGDQCWDTWEEFETAFWSNRKRNRTSEELLHRYRNLMPAWAMQKPDGTEEDGFWDDPKKPGESPDADYKETT